RGALAEINPEDAAILDHGIGALPDALAELRACGLSRRFQALSRCVEQPAMKGAAQAAILQSAKGKVGAAMRAVPLDQPVTAVLAAKQHQVLAEQFDRADRPRTLQLVDQRRRLPVTPHQFSA